MKQLQDMNDIVHVRVYVHRSKTFYFDDSRLTLCESQANDTFFTRASLRPVDKPVTCVMCMAATETAE